MGTASATSKPRSRKKAPRARFSVVSLACPSELTSPSKKALAQMILSTVECMIFIISAVDGEDSVSNTAA